MKLPIRHRTILLAGLTLAAVVAVAESPQPLTFGIYLADVEEGARIFGPIEFLPFEHPVASGHQFPNPARFHTSQVETLVHLGRGIGLELATTLQRYPDPPTAEWPYPAFAPPDVAAIEAAPIRRAESDAPIPGLRVVVFDDGFPQSFILDTRGMSLRERGMQRATSMGLDLSRAAFLEGLREAGRLVPEKGTWVLVFPAALSAGGLSEREAADLLGVWRDDYRTPQEYIVSKFEDHNWVVLGEYHRIRHDVQLVSSLIPVLHRETAVRRLALEFLCRERTEEASRLVTAEEYDRREALEFFRDQFAGWPYHEYLEIFEQAWASNRKYAADRGSFELVGLHPCIDWERVHYGSEAEAAVEKAKQQRYDEIMAESLEESVLEPGHKALVFTGIAHATGKFTEYRFGTDQPLVRMGNLVYREPYRSKLFFVSLHAPFWDSAREKDIYPFDGVLDRLMLEFGRDVGFDVVGTPFENLLHRHAGRHSITWYRFGELYDGYVIFRTPIKEYTGVTCIEEWIEDEADFEHFWRNVSNKKASEAHSRTPFDEFKRDFCAPRPDHGDEFRKRFRRLSEH